jgi:uncharacterized membrane protein YkoI
MKRRTKILLAVAVLAALAAIPARAIAGGDGDQPITGPALEQASEAAITYLGGGVVTDTEIDDEESYYEVEVTLEDGSQVDVQLDENFAVVGSEADDENDDEGADSDD